MIKYAGCFPPGVVRAEIRAIVQDPVIQNVLQEISANPMAAQKSVRIARPPKCRFISICSLVDSNNVLPLVLARPPALLRSTGTCRTRRSWTPSTSLPSQACSSCVPSNPRKRGRSLALGGNRTHPCLLPTSPLIHTPSSLFLSLSPRLFLTTLPANNARSVLLQTASMQAKHTSTYTLVSQRRK